VAGSPEFDQILHCTGWWPPERISCSVDSGAEAAPPPELAAAVEAAWQDHLARYPRDFDGRILHPKAWQVDSAGVRLQAVPMRFALLAARRAPQFSAAQRRRIPGPLGLSVIPMGSDGQVVVARRSASVSVARGSLFFFGGFGEPPAPGAGLDLCAEALRELHEELGEGFEVRRFGMLGIGEHSAGHLDVTFLAELDRTAVTVIAGAAGASDAHEWDRLAAVAPDALMHLVPADLGARCTTFAFDLGRWLLARHLDLPPPAMPFASRAG